MQDKSTICQKVIQSFFCTRNVKGERRYWRKQERMRLQSLAEEQNQIKREASAVNQRPEKVGEDDVTVPAPSSYDQFMRGNL